MTLSHNPLQTYVESDPKWVENSWKKCREQIYSFLQSALSPKYELTLMRLIWKGHARHSFLRLEIWNRSRTRACIFDLELVPVLIAIFTFKPFNRTASINNLRAHIGETLKGALTWQIRSYDQAMKVWQLHSKINDEEILIGQFGGN